MPASEARNTTSAAPAPDTDPLHRMELGDRPLRNLVEVRSHQGEYLRCEGPPTLRERVLPRPLRTVRLHQRR